MGEEAEIIVARNSVEFTRLYPQRRVYLASGTPSTEMAIDAGFLRDLFVTLGEQKESGAWSMTLYVKPFIRWVWLGAIFMAFGASIAAADKRYRRLRSKSEARNKTANTQATTLQPATNG